MTGQGWMVRCERLRRGWSVADLAGHLKRAAWRLGEMAGDIDAVVVAGWESGARTIGFRHLRLLADVLAVPFPDLLGFTDQGQQCEWLTLARAGCTVASGDEDAMLRREFLRYVAALAGASMFEHQRLAAALAGARMDGRLVEDLAVLTEQYAAAMWTTSADRMLPLLHGHLAILRRLLTGAAPVTERLLAPLAGHTALAVGRLDWQANRREPAEFHWSLAMRLAAQGEDKALEAEVMGACVRVRSPLRPGSDGGDSRAVLELLEAALERAPRRAHHLRAWLYAHRIEESAATGNAVLSDEATEDAHHELARVSGHGSGYLSPWGPDGARLAGYEGAACLRLGRHREAVHVLESALAGIPNGMTKLRAAVLADLGEAHAGKPLPDVEHACALLGEALTLAAARPSTVRRVAEVRARHLDPHAAEPAVQRLNEAILTARAG
jgi:hypothetical protein